MTMKLASYPTNVWFGVPILSRGRDPASKSKIYDGHMKKLLELPDFDNIDSTQLMSSLREVLIALRPTIESSERDAQISMASLIVSFPEPLDAYEIQLLAVATLVCIADKSAYFGYAAVIEITDMYMAKAMNPPTIYKTLTKLVERGFLDEAGRERDPDTHRPAKRYRLNASGRAAFRTAAMNALVLESVQARRAA